MQRVKGALDPAGVLNRGVVLPDPLGAGGGTGTWSTPAAQPLEPAAKAQHCSTAGTP
jgi:hypothetical protein